MVFGFQFSVKKPGQQIGFLCFFVSLRLIFNPLAGGLLWHEKPCLDKDLSEPGGKLTEDAANANILSTFWHKVFTENRKLKTGNRLKMEIKALDFFLGLTLGAVLGAGLTLGVIKVRGWLGHSEVGRLKSENRTLKRRLVEKDRHIGRMLSETERLAEKLGKEKT